MPGFDRVLPDLDAALAVLQEFRDMHPDQEVRVASHLPGQDRIGEALAPDLLFGQPDGDTRLRPLLPARWPAALAAGLAALGLSVGFTMWMRHQREVERATLDAARHLAATAASRAQASAQRARRLGSLLEQAGRPGLAPLDRWRAAIAALPLSRAGWTLQQVDWRSLERMRRHLGAPSRQPRDAGRAAGRRDRRAVDAARAVEPARTPSRPRCRRRWRTPSSRR